MSDEGSDRRDEPPVSLVIASRRGGEALFACLESFVRAGDSQLEIVVAESAHAGTPAEIRARFPQVKVLHVPKARTIPDLRAAGLRDARGHVVALTGDHCRATAHWLPALRRGHRESAAAAIGGAIENGATTRLIDWAVFFCEYGRYMLPFPHGETIDLPGQNVSYKRSAVDVLTRLPRPATWEPLWHWHLHAHGLTLVRDPAIVVTLHKHFTFRGFLRERYHYARSFAGQRVEGRSWLWRTAYVAGTPLLPPLVLARLAWDGLRRRRHGPQLLCCVPYLACFAIAWAIGECVGYAAGSGQSAQQID